jgi:hypothetical protein
VHAQNELRQYLRTVLRRQIGENYAFGDFFRICILKTRKMKLSSRDDTRDVNASYGMALDFVRDRCAQRSPRAQQNVLVRCEFVEPAVSAHVVGFLRPPDGIPRSAKRPWRAHTFSTRFRSLGTCGYVYGNRLGTKRVRRARLRF